MENILSTRKLYHKVKKDQSDYYNDQLKNNIESDHSPINVQSLESKNQREGTLSRDSRDRTLNNTRISDQQSIVQNNAINSCVEGTVPQNESRDKITLDQPSNSNIDKIEEQVSNESSKFNSVPKDINNLIPSKNLNSTDDLLDSPTQKDIKQNEELIDEPINVSKLIPISPKNTKYSNFYNGNSIDVIVKKKKNDPYLDSLNKNTEDVYDNVTKQNNTIQVSKFKNKKFLSRLISAKSSDDSITISSSLKLNRSNSNQKQNSRNQLTSIQDQIGGTSEYNRPKTQGYQETKTDFREDLKQFQFTNKSFYTNNIKNNNQNSRDNTRNPSMQNTEQGNFSVLNQNNKEYINISSNQTYIQSKFQNLEKQNNKINDEIKNKLENLKIEDNTLSSSIYTRVYNRNKMSDCNNGKLIAQKLIKNDQKPKFAINLKKTSQNQVKRVSSAGSLTRSNKNNFNFNDN